MSKDPKFYVKKRTKSGRYITVAEGNTRNEVIENLKRDSETYRERTSKQDEQKVY
tara:strand:+ start:458 stop:622 length:165 start_codon:yes stop_codon:yes gene_type:complete